VNLGANGKPVSDILEESLDLEPEDIKQSLLSFDVSGDRSYALPQKITSVTANTIDPLGISCANPNASAGDRVPPVGPDDPLSTRNDAKIGPTPHSGECLRSANRTIQETRPCHPDRCDRKDIPAFHSQTFVKMP